MYPKGKMRNTAVAKENGNRGKHELQGVRDERGEWDDMACCGEPLDNIRRLKIEFFGVTPARTEHVAPHGDMAGHEDAGDGGLVEDGGGVQEVQQIAGGAPETSQHARLEEADQKEGEDDEAVGITRPKMRQGFHPRWG